MSATVVERSKSTILSVDEVRGSKLGEVNKLFFQENNFFKFMYNSARSLFTAVYTNSEHLPSM